MGIGRSAASIDTSLPETITDIWANSEDDSISGSVDGSDWQERDSIGPVSRLGCRPYQNQVVGDFPNWKMLRNDDQAGTAPRPRELDEVSRHGRLVVRDQDAAIAGGESKDVVVLEAGKTRCRGGSEVDGGRAPQDSGHDDLVQIRVGLKANAHSAREWRVLLGLGQLLVEHRVRVARGLSCGGEVLTAILEVAVDVVPMS